MSLMGWMDERCRPIETAELGLGVRKSLQRTHHTTGERRGRIMSGVMGRHADSGAGVRGGWLVRARDNSGGKVVRRASQSHVSSWEDGADLPGFPPSRESLLLKGVYGYH